MERNSNKILLTVLGIAVLVVATIGATFAYFSATASGDKQSVTTGELKVAATSTPIEEAAIKPTTFAIGTAKDNADVGHGTLVVNTAGTTVTGGYYDIYLTTELSALNETLEGGSAADVKWAVYDGTTLVASGDFATLSSNEKITKDTIAADGSEKTYDLFIYVEETNVPQNQLQAVTASATLSVVASTQTVAQP